MPDPTPAAAERTEPGAHADDLALARAVASGSQEAWHRFIRRYSPLILAVIRRHVRPRDEVRTLYADVLARLYQGGLVTYQGRSALSTWLVPVTHGVVIDDLRRRLGGRGLKHALKGLDPIDRAVFRHYYLEGLSFGAVRGLVRDAGGTPIDGETLLEALRRIEDRVSTTSARRLHYDVHAQSVGAASGRLLEYFDHVRIESADGERTQSPEFQLVEREARALVDEVMARIASLPEEERRLLTLRFERGWTARRIADELGLDPRSVYTGVDRVLRGIRRLFRREAGGQGTPRPPRGPAAPRGGTHAGENG